jgi:glycosyltransferase involved in cell wall biosynthesis
MEVIKAFREPDAGSCLTVLIPAYNEEQGIGDTVKSLLDEPRLAEAEIIVMDDGSSDRTSEIAEALGVRVVRNRFNCGYGASIKRGVRLSTTEFVAWFDADGQHRVSDLADMLDCALQEQSDAVIGARTANSHFVKCRALGKKVIHWSAQIAAAKKIPDVNCGLRVFRLSVLKQYLHLLPNGFSASTTSTLIFLQRNPSLIFHPVQVDERVGKSSVSQWRDGMRALHTIVRILILFNALRTFSYLSAGFLISGLLYGIPLAVMNGQGFPVLAGLLIGLGIQVFCLGIVCDQISALRLEQLESSRDEADSIESENERRAAA